jgi:hypothetical protein
MTARQRRACWYRHRSRVVVHGRFDAALTPSGYQGRIAVEKIVDPPS